jgi:hypothetical protein
MWVTCMHVCWLTGWRNAAEKPKSYVCTYAWMCKKKMEDRCKKDEVCIAVGVRWPYIHACTYSNYAHTVTACMYVRAYVPFWLAVSAWCVSQHAYEFFCASTQCVMAVCDFKRVCACLCFVCGSVTFVLPASVWWLCACVYVCLCVCVCKYIYIYIHTLSLSHSHTNVHTHIYLLCVSVPFVLPASVRWQFEEFDRVRSELWFCRSCHG